MQKNDCLNMTVAQAKEMMRPLLKKGTICPCCCQPVRMYRRPLTSAMAYALILMYNCPENAKSVEGYIHIENYFKSLKEIPASIRGDVPKLRFWGLIEPWPGNTEEGDGNPNSGLYRVTEKGKFFVELKMIAPPVVKIYNNKFYGFEKDLKNISIVEALKKKFNYRELMGLPEAALTPQI